MGKIKKLGILTGGGDAPGLNPAIKSVVYNAAANDIECIGIYDGWQGLLDGYCEEAVKLEPVVVRRWDRDGGTNIGSSRTNPFRINPPGGGESVDRSGEVLRNMERLGLDALVAMGGEDTLGVAAGLAGLGARVVGIPKTIDKDLWGTDYTLGFDTALLNCTETIDRSRTPAGSHHWVQVVEVMGRNAGHLALWSGVSGGACLILIPEYKFRYERVFDLLQERLSRGTRDRRYPRYAVIVVAEGATAEQEGLVTIDPERDAFGHERLGGIGAVLSKQIRKHISYDSRAVALGHSQRGGSPSPIDRIMGLLFGAEAVRAITRGDFGKMIAARGIAPACRFGTVDLQEIAGKVSLVDVERWYDTERYHLKASLEP
ncbi:MAG: ATP-dependent 6-phosphofructokinase [Candidatus Tectomicrobia bacterium]|uniref:ATP-dependent 6-phosphofructokinase n=1 Tax=Tectimicrobiota bacterium TaxID=2528274 RepID=A0A932FXY1_UNCTE|nr:ATP-dependent 6-phosphofructokinase [Candidatus Tectomicrobia bacterium]